MSAREIIICHMRQLRVGDRIAFWGHNEPTCATVARVDDSAKDVTARFDSDGCEETWPWDSKRSRGYNKVKRELREGEEL